MSIVFLDILVVSALNCFHTGGISISCVGLRTHQPNTQKISLPSKVKGADIDSTVVIVTAIDRTWITNVAICCNSAKESVFGV